jgi:hypothetical protein
MTDIEPTPPPAPPVTKKSSVKAGWSLGLGIGAMMFPIPVIDLGMGITGICLACSARKISPDGLSMAGLVCSIIGTVMSFFYTIFVVFFATAFFAMLTSLVL